ncbi:MAG: hypothetical protein OXC95_04095 [Dehalococcoidia bacterium]|nr:hypothetical protein [Dehalococcoidia bacterium]
MKDLHKPDSTLSMTYCDEKHFSRATEFHINGELCGPWLENIERGHFTGDQKDFVLELVMRDYMYTFHRRIDNGQFMRLCTSLVLAHDPNSRPKPWWKFWGKVSYTGVEFGAEPIRAMLDNDNAQTSAGQKSDG